MLDPHKANIDGSLLKRPEIQSSSCQVPAVVDYQSRMAWEPWVQGGPLQPLGVLTLTLYCIRLEGTTRSRQGVKLFLVSCVSPTEGNPISTVSGKRQHMCKMTSHGHWDHSTDVLAELAGWRENVKQSVIHLSRSTVHIPNNKTNHHLSLCLESEMMAVISP